MKKGLQCTYNFVYISARAQPKCSLCQRLKSCGFCLCLLKGGGGGYVDPME